MDSRLLRALSDLTVEWPAAGWTPDAAGDEQTGFHGRIGEHVVFANLTEPDDELATDTLRWEATCGDVETLGRSAVEAVRLVLRRVARG